MFAGFSGILAKQRQVSSRSDPENSFPTANNPGGIYSLQVCEAPSVRTTSAKEGSKPPAHRIWASISCPLRLSLMGPAPEARCKPPCHPQPFRLLLSQQSKPAPETSFQPGEKLSLELWVTSLHEGEVVAPTLVHPRT